MADFVFEVHQFTEGAELDGTTDQHDGFVVETGAGVGGRDHGQEGAVGTEDADEDVRGDDFASLLLEMTARVVDADLEAMASYREALIEFRSELAWTCCGLTRGCPALILEVNSGRSGGQAGIVKDGPVQTFFNRHLRW